MSIYQKAESTLLSLCPDDKTRLQVSFCFSWPRPFVRRIKSSLGLHTLAGLSSEKYAADRLWELGYYSCAVQLYERMVANRGETFEHLYELGRCYLKCERPNAALPVFEKAAALRQDTAAVFYQIGLTYFILEKYTASLSALRSGIKQEESHVASYLLITKVLIASGNFDFALRFAQELVEDAEATETAGYAKYVLAQILLKKDKASEAEELLHQWHKLHPENLLVKACLGQIAEMVGKPEEAQVFLDSVLTDILVQQVGSKVTYTQNHIIHIARELSGMGLYSAAAFAFNKAIDLDPERFNHQIDYGTVLYRLGRYTEALDEFNLAVSATPDREFEVLFHIARCYLRSGEPQVALEKLEKLLAIEPNNFRAKVELAKLHRNLGNFSEAKRWIVGVPPGVAESLRDVILGDLAVYEGNYEVDLPSVVNYKPTPGRVLHVIETSLPHKTSGYTYRSQYILLNQKKHGFDVLATTRPGFPADVCAGEFSSSSVKDDIRYDHNEIDGPANYNKQPLNFYLKTYAERVLSIATEFQPEIIHSASNFKNGLAAAAAAKALNIPWTYELRGIWEDTQVSKGAITEESDRYKYFRAAETHCLQEANAVITLSKTLKEEIASRGIAEEKVFVVPNAVDVEKFPVVTKDLELAKELELGTGPVIGYISSLVAYEGINLLIDSFAKLLKFNSDAKLLIVGGGDEFENLQSQVSELNLEGKAILTGRVPHDQVLRYYSLIDIFVVPRLPWRVCEIVTPLKPYEAMSTGRTVVVSDVSALKEMIIDGQTGLCFKAGDKNSLASVLRNLLRNPEQCKQLGDNAASWVRKNRTWEMVTAEYKKAYQFALAQHTKPEQKKAVAS